MTKGVPLLGYRMRTCSECNELFDPKKGEITYEQVHYYEETADTCAMSQWLEYLCGCKDVRERIMKRLGLDTEEKEDEYYDNQPDCTCEKKIFTWVCEDCRIDSC